MAARSLACERRRISGGVKRQSEIRLRSQATRSSVCLKILNDAMVTLSNLVFFGVERSRVFLPIILLLLSFF